MVHSPRCWALNRPVRLALPRWYGRCSACRPMPLRRAWPLVLLLATGCTLGVGPSGPGEPLEEALPPGELPAEVQPSVVGGDVPRGPPGGLELSSPLVLDRRVAAQGETVFGQVSYRNVSGEPVGVRQLILAARPPGGTSAGGPFLDFSPKQGPVTLAPGETVTLKASRTLARTDPVGEWYAYSTWQDARGVFRDEAQHVTFRVEAPLTRVYGTLNPNPARAGQVFQAGFRTAEFVISWARYEPTQGKFDPAYTASRKADLQAFLAAGIRPTLSFSHHYTPAWVCLLPGASFVNQRGESRCGKPHNLVFSQTVRTAMVRAIEQLSADFGLSHFSAVRVMTAGVSGEISYPGGGSYWAYDANASGGADRPSTIPVRPFGNWKPGEATLTPEQVRVWLEWYLAALADAVDFQVLAYERLGYSGVFHPIQPGAAVKPRDVVTAINCRLGCGSVYLGQGVAWYNLFGLYKTRSRLTVYTSSLGEKAVGQDCLSTDAAELPTSAVVSSFDVGRYTGWIASQYGVRAAGENPGPLEANYGGAMMKAALRVAASCKYSHLYWAHEDQLFETSRPGLSLADFAAEAAQVQSSAP